MTVAVHHGKISPEFSARLARSKTQLKVHAVVVLYFPDSSDKPARTRPSEKQRLAALDKIQTSAAEAFPEIDSILQRFDGRRLSDKPSALGTIPVESTPAGIAALSG